MKQLIILVGYCFIVSGLVGCQNATREVDAAIEESVGFPEFLVGRWKANRDGWEFVFEPDGTISSVVVNIGRAKLTAGELTRFPARYGGEGVFEPGNWVVEYEPETRKLEVQIVIDHFYLDSGKDAWEGSSTDVFTGLVSQDGKELTMEWYGFPEIVLYIGSKGERFELPITDPNEHDRGTLIFTKVASEK